MNFDGVHVLNVCLSKIDVRVKTLAIEHECNLFLRIEAALGLECADDASDRSRLEGLAWPKNTISGQRTYVLDDDL